MRTRIVLAAAVMVAAPLTITPPAVAAGENCVSRVEGQHTRDGETRQHAERRYGERGDLYHGRFEVWSTGSHHRKFWVSYAKCGPPPGLRLWVLYHRRPGPDLVGNWTWLIES